MQFLFLTLIYFVVVFLTARFFVRILNSYIDDLVDNFLNKLVKRLQDYDN